MNGLRPLRVVVENDELIIRIGCLRIDGNDDHPEIPELPIADSMDWGKDVKSEMNRDRGDGATPLSLFIDDMILKAIENGPSGLDMSEYKKK